MTISKVSSLAASLLLVTSASAGTVTSSFNTALRELPFDNQAGQLALFDSSLGTLTDVWLTLSIDNVATVIFTSLVDTPQQAGVSWVDTLTFGSTLGALNALLGSNHRLTTSGDTGTVTAPVIPNHLTVGPLTDSDTVTLDTELDGILGSFIGAGMFGIDCDGRSVTSHIGTNFASSTSNKVSCAASITYTFASDVPTDSTLPEPSSLALVGLALAPLLRGTRRRDRGPV